MMDQLVLKDGFMLAGQMQVRYLWRRRGTSRVFRCLMQRRLKGKD